MSSESVIRSLYLKWITCWNDRNAEAMGPLFSENVTVIGFDGSQMNGRADAQTQLAQIFKDYPTGEFVTVIDEVRMINSQTAIVRAAAGIMPRGFKDINPNVNAIQTLIASQHSGDWQIELFQNTPAAFHGRPELQQELTARLRAALKDNTSTH